MTVFELAAMNGFTALNLPEPDREITGAYAGDLLSWVMGRAKEGDAWITIMSNINVAAVASLADVACVVFSEGVDPDEQLLDAAKAKGINLVKSESPTYETAVLISGNL